MITLTRFLAYVIDILVLGLLFLTLKNLLITVSYELINLFLAFITFLYFFLLETIYARASLGKRVVKINVHYEKENKVLVSGLMRAIVFTLLTCIPAYVTAESKLSIIIIGWFIFNFVKALPFGDRKLIQDMISSTYVCDTKTSLKTDLLKNIAIAFVSLILSYVYLYHFSLNGRLNTKRIITETSMNIDHKIKERYSFRSHTVIQKIENLEYEEDALVITVEVPFLAHDKVARNKSIKQLLEKISLDDKMKLITKSYSVLVIKTEGILRKKAVFHLFPIMMEHLREQVETQSKWRQLNKSMQGQWTGFIGKSYQSGSVVWDVLREEDQQFSITFYKDVAREEVRSTERGQFLFIGDYYITQISHIDDRVNQVPVYEVYKILSRGVNCLFYESLRTGDQFTIKRSK